MTYLIFGDTFTFPEGTAATNRVFNYAKGLLKNKINVKVICFGNAYLINPNGTIEGIEYYNPFNQSKRNKWFFKRRIIEYSN